MKNHFSSLAALVILATFGLVTWNAVRPFLDQRRRAETHPQAEEALPLAAVDRFFEASWQEAGLKPAESADELQVLRRLSLALHGTIPSLQEIRHFEADRGPRRLERWTARMLQDRRFADHCAARLSRSILGDAADQLPVFTRDRFVKWLSAELHQGRPFDELVREMITSRGLWTDHPATQYTAAQIVQGDLYQQRLAGRAVRAFLGQRMDCAQCHDHPFQEWKQAEFEGVAAFFGQVRLTVLGVQDQEGRTFEVETRTGEKREVEPRVPFHPEWLAATGTPRERFAGWVTHPENRRFARAMVNRVWDLMFGRPFSAPVDDLPDPPADGADPDLLDLLAEDFQAHGYDLKRLIRVIAASRPFRLSSRHAELGDEESAIHLENAWAVFPLTRLGPDAFFASLEQASTLLPVREDGRLLTFLPRYFGMKKLIREYGDPGENEQEVQGGTIAQATLRMNSDIVRQRSAAQPTSASGRIVELGEEDAIRLEVCYLVCLARRPTEIERDHFQAQLREAAGSEKSRVVEDIFWALFNSPEFSWNH